MKKKPKMTMKEAMKKNEKSGKDKAADMKQVKSMLKKGGKY
jgi:hypothetical protein